MTRADFTEIQFTNTLDLCKVYDTLKSKLFAMKSFDQSDPHNCQQV